MSLHDLLDALDRSVRYLVPLLFVLALIFAGLAFHGAANLLGA